MGNIHQEDITIVSICAQNTRTPSFINQTLKGVNNHTGSNTKIMTDLNILPSSKLKMNNNYNQKPSKLNYSINQLDLLGVWRIFQTTDR